MLKLLFTSTGPATSLPLASGKEVGSRSWPQRNLRQCGGDFLLDYYSAVQGPQKLYRNNCISIILYCHHFIAIFLLQYSYPLSVLLTCTPWVNAQKSSHHTVFFVTKADKLAVAFQDPVGSFCGTGFHLAYL